MQEKEQHASFFKGLCPMNMLIGKNIATKFKGGNMKILVRWDNSNNNKNNNTTLFIPFGSLQLFYMIFFEKIKGLPAP